MNPETLLNMACEAIENRVSSDRRMWILCWLHDRIEFIPAHNKEHPEIIFGRWNIDTIEKGLTVKEWHDLSVKLLEFWRQKSL